MAKKTKTNAKARKTGLVGTQRAAIEAHKTKRDLAGLAAKLAAKHGTAEQQALKRAEIEALKRDEIEALVEELAFRAHERKRVHLSEMGGWPVCWADERREAVRPRELLLTPISTDAGAVTCTRCKKAADLPTPAQAATAVTQRRSTGSMPVVTRKIPRPGAGSSPGPGILPDPPRL